MVKTYKMEISEDQLQLLIRAVAIAKKSPKEWVQIEEKDPSWDDCHGMHFMLCQVEYSENEQPGRLHRFYD